MEVYKIPVVLSDEDMLYLTHLKNLRKQQGEQLSHSGLLAAIVDTHISTMLKKEIKTQEFRERISTAVLAVENQKGPDNEEKETIGQEIN